MRILYLSHNVNVVQLGSAGPNLQLRDLFELRRGTAHIRALHIPTDVIPHKYHEETMKLSTKCRVCIKMDPRHSDRRESGGTGGKRKLSCTMSFLSSGPTCGIGLYRPLSNNTKVRPCNVHKRALHLPRQASPNQETSDT